MGVDQMTSESAGVVSAEAAGVRAQLVAPAAGSGARFVFRLEDAATGQPVTDLEPYLGAPAHVVVLGQDGRAFAHTHGEPVGSPPAAAGGGYGVHAASGGCGPEIAFHHIFPAPALHKVWGPFRTADDRVITADFVVRVQ
jgi:Cu+-exporting ATPase